ncbi:hypothetical protein CCO02nite_26320 [Cellulomonas composti]|uniref:Peptidoglycan binding-like domain-containing protein n=1 Tax=Cellulomonas composti TaxID=266130 RepID=A0A511JDC2_9CELL|nr:hypothetical protein CCO02nite_26320 [Cellulomonas composti]
MAGTALGVVVVAGIAWAPSAVPGSLAAGPAVTAAPVTYEDYDDARETPFTFVTSPSEDVELRRAGTVTSVDCAAGGTLTSGDVPVTVDAAPVVALHTEYPVWRDLAPGDSGPDVAAVQAELVRLGYDAGTSAVVDVTTSAAVHEFLTDRGAPASDAALTRDTVVWLPEPSLVVTRCALEVADVVEAGDTLLTTGGVLVALEPAVLVDGLAPGARTARFDDVAAPVDEDGRVTDAAFLAAVSSSPEYAFAANQQDTVPELAFTTALTTPLRAAAVPAGALFGIDGSSACLASDGVPRRVTIVSSSLGSTFVTFDDGAAPTSVDLQVPADRTAAGATCT